MEFLSDSEHHIDTDDFMPPLRSANILSSDFDFNASIEENFFKHVFPSITWHAQIIDKFLSDPQAPYYDMVQYNKIKFQDPNDPDQDWKVKQCYEIIIAAVTEVENGIENLWKRGMKKKRYMYPDFGWFIAINEFRALCSAAPYTAGQMRSIGIIHNGTLPGMNSFPASTTTMTSMNA